MPALQLFIFSIGSHHLRDGKTGFGKYWDIGTCSSVGGVSCMLTFFNRTEKTIKYITFALEPYNPVGDICKCETTGVSVAHIRLVGPIEPGEYGKNDSDRVIWYNRTITSAKILYADLEFMDGTTRHVNPDEIEHPKPTNSTSNSNGCYVATAVYGSYNCPQVWTLRRFRDNILAKTWYGRAFIKTYYAISPSLVKWFGRTEWFKKMWQGKLDRLVAKLQANGVESTPYQDKKW